MSYFPRVPAFFGTFWQKQGTAAVGVWLWGANASQTNFASVTGEGAGYYYNNSGIDLDEYKWSNVFLTKGTYKITIVAAKASSWSIAEVLFGTTSLGTIDMYAVDTIYNQVFEINFTLTADTTADLRFRINGKNPLSSAYYNAFSRFQMEKTA